MAIDPTTLLIPEADFVPEIDSLLEKHRPSLTVPWSLHERPAWAKDFQPRRILDIGAGLGAFTSSHVDCMNHWSCLTQLSEVVLLDGEQALFRPTLVDGTLGVCQRVRAKLGAAGATATVRYDVRNAEVAEDRVTPLDELPWKADLIVASHVTYYIGDGSGLEFVRLLAERHLAPQGRIWLVIRRLHCPIYEVRARTLEAMGRNDPKPLDYAERFEALAQRKLPKVRVVANMTMRFAIRRAEAERLRAIHMLMWRSAPDAAFPEGERAAREAARAVTPFHEEHFVLQAGGGA